MAAKPRQDGRLVTRTGADLEHPMMLLQLQLLGHVGHHEGLADGLAAGDAEGAVAVGVGAIGRLHEDVARNRLHGAQHRLIADPAPPQVELKHHLFRWILSGRHLDLVGLPGHLSAQPSDSCNRTQVSLRIQVPPQGTQRDTLALTLQAINPVGQR
jgi:hypothetical protein